MDEVVLQTKHLFKRYGRLTAVNDLSLTLYRGEVFGLLGPNGAGKTTTISMLAGVTKPSGGHIRLLGSDLISSREVLRRVGVLIESSTFYPYLSGRDNLRVAAYQLLGQASGRIDYVLEVTGLSDKARQKFKHYSTGMKQRLGIAAALLNQPEILFLDEPTQGLDPAGQLSIRRLIKELSQSGVTILLSSHLLHDVEQMCGRVLVLNRGNVVMQGEVEKLTKHRNEWQIRISDPVRATAVLQNLDVVQKVWYESEWLFVKAQSEQISAISAALARENLHPTEIHPRETSLEQLFIELTA